MCGRATARGYFYKKSGAQLLRNRLYHLQDNADPGNLLVNPGAGEDAKDIAYDNSAYMDTTQEAVEQGNNYRYDALGNLVKDRREGIDTVLWTVAGKVRKVLHAGGGADSLNFTYGADGQRASKTVGNPYVPGGFREWYIRDAQGNIMATYRYANEGPASLQVTERPIYGSKRLGGYAEAQQLLPATAVPANYAHPMLAARTRYELADHLGNVRATVSGQLVPSANPASAFEPHLLSEMAYEPFGSLLPGRNYSSANYRFLFQGQLHDDEVHGATGTSYAFDYRMDDPRVGRFLSIDPLAAVFAYNSPYAFSENRVVDMIELEGLEARPTEDKLQPQQPNGNGTYNEPGDRDYFGASYRLNPPSDKPSAKIPSAATSERLHPAHGGSKFVSGPTISASVPPSYALPYTAPALTQAQEQIHEKFNFANDLLGVAYLMMDGTEKALMSSAANTQFKYAVRTATGRIMNAAEATTAAKIGLESAADIAKTAGRAFGLLGVGVTAFDAFSDGNVTWGDGAKMVIGVATTFTPLGWAYGALDLGVSIYTGKSLTDRAAEMIDKW